MKGNVVTERIIFRVLRMPCCGHLLCWVNPRLPNYCPECGAGVLARLRIQRESVQINDTEAFLKYHA